MDALTLLTADHNRVRGLFARFETAQERDDSAIMADLASTIFAELEVHTTIEEEIFYPQVHELSEEIGEVVDEGIQEHHVAKMLIDEAKGLTPGTDEWTAKMSVLIENVEHHAEEEEQEMFPKIRSHSSAGDREALGQRLDERKGELGAPTLAATIDFSDSQLRELATDQEIPGRSTMDHDELAAAVAPPR
jgi:hemerythrin superfamily protein